MDSWFSPETWMTLPVFASAVAWVGRVHQRVNQNDKDIQDLEARFEQNLKENNVFYQRVANIDGKLDTMQNVLNRIEDRLNK